MLWSALAIPALKVLNFFFLFGLWQKINLSPSTCCMGYKLSFSSGYTCDGGLAE